MRVEHCVEGCPANQIFLLDHDEPFRFAERQRPDQQRVNHAEQYGVGADPKRHREGRRDCEAWTSPEAAVAENDILKERAHGKLRPPPTGGWPAWDMWYSNSQAGVLTWVRLSGLPCCRFR